MLLPALPSTLPFTTIITFHDSEIVQINLCASTCSRDVDVLNQMLRDLTKVPVKVRKDVHDPFILTRVILRQD